MTIAYREYDAESIQSLTDDLVQVFLAAYSSMGMLDDFNSENRFRAQLAGHTTASPWKGVLAFDGERLIGFAYGFPLSPQTGWWQGIVNEPEPGFTTETGARTFAVSEILVLAEYQRQGIATAMHEQLLADRPEERATLLAEADNAPAQTTYANWGWRKVNRLRPDWGTLESPTYDVMILPLPTPPA